MNSTGKIVLKDGIRKDFVLLSARRRVIWENFFKKICDESKDESSFALNDIPVDLDKRLDKYTNKVSTINLTKNEQHIIDTIENKLQSNLNELILQREKAKILYDYDSYSRVHTAAKGEIRRLRKVVSRSDVENYIGLCVIPNKDVEFYIENILESNLKQSIINQLSSLPDSLPFMLWTAEVLVEFNYLTRVLSEEDVVIYAANVSKKM